MNLPALIEDLKIVFSDIKKLAKNVLFGDMNNISLNKIKIATYAETVELLDNYNWKPWSKKENNQITEINKKVELVDVIILSSIIFMKKYNRLPNDKEIKNLIESFNNKKISKNEVEEIENFLLNLHNIEEQPILEKTFNLAKHQIQNMNNLIYYIESKIVLSSFRNEMGYKDGLYQKNWNGLEDNHFMYLKILPNLINENYDLDKFKKVLRNKLLESYKNISLKNNLKNKL